MENKYNSIELKSKQTDTDVSHPRNAQYLSQIRYTRQYVRLLFSKQCKNWHERKNFIYFGGSVSYSLRYNVIHSVHSHDISS